jgi:hypothetical protein
MKRRTRNHTNRNEWFLAIGATVFGLMVLGTVAVAQISSYMAWANQFHG